MTPAFVIFMGLRASGKSTVAAAVASRLSLPLVELDAVVAQRAGVADAAELIRRDGIAAFRAAEVEAFAQALANAHPKVISLGGGTPTAPGAAEALKAVAKSAAIIYLRAQAATLKARLAATDLAQRPSLTGKGTLEEVESVLEARDGLYSTLATHIVDVDGLDAAAVIDAAVRIASGR